MAKKKERAVNVSGKPRHSLDVNRANDKKGAGGGGGRSAATVRRLKMYNTRPKRDRSGKVLKHDLQSKELPNTRIEPDRRWFGNTRVVNQKELEFFREELQSRLSNNYNVILKERKLPLSLLQDHQKQARAHLLDTEPFEHAFGPKGKRKRPKLLAFDYESLLNKADDSQDAFEEKYASSKLPKEEEEDGLRDLVRHTMFEKGQSKRIWGELYKVIDSSDVVVQASVATFFPRVGCQGSNGHKMLPSREASEGERQTQTLVPVSSITRYGQYDIVVTGSKHGICWISSVASTTSAFIDGKQSIHGPAACS